MNFNIKDKIILCTSCTSSHITKNSRGKEYHFCNALEKEIPDNITECNRYSRMGEMTDYEAKKIGWILETKNGKIGFRPPEPKDKYD